MDCQSIADLYLRLSIDGESKTSIDRQETDCREWAYRNELTVRKVHIDRGRSGYSKVNRAGLDAALTAITAGVAGVLVVWKLDRLSRRGVGELGLVLDEFDRVGGRLVSVIDGLDTAEPGARESIAVLAELARSESSNIGARVSNAKRHFRRRGWWPGGRPPYGLMVDPWTKKLVHDPETAVYARLIADEVLSGKSLVHVARLLNESGVESPRGGMWNSSTVVQLVRSPALAGLMPQTAFIEQPDGTRKYGNRTAPFIDPETLDVVSVGEGIISVEERELIIRRLEARTFPGAGRRHGRKEGSALLTGLLRCGRCGSRMSKAGTSYQCSDHRMGRSCEGVSVSVESLDGYVRGAFLLRLPALENGDQLLAAITDRLSRMNHPELYAKRDAVLAEIADQERRLAALEEARYARDEFAGEQAVKRYVRLRGMLTERLERLRAGLVGFPAVRADVTPLLDAELLSAAWEADDAAGRRRRLALAIDAIEVRKGKVGARFDGDERCRVYWAKPG